MIEVNGKIRLTGTGNRIPCTHCGDCCRGEVCPIGEIFLHTTEAPCPALVEKDGEYWCGLVATARFTMYAKTRSAKYWAGIFAKYLAEEVFHFGAGCDSLKKEVDNETIEISQ